MYYAHILIETPEAEIKETGGFCPDTQLHRYSQQQRRTSDPVNSLKAKGRKA